MRLKQTALFFLCIIPMSAFANFTVILPLEASSGGSLPNSSIVFSNSGGDTSIPPPPPVDSGTDPVDPNEDPRMQACRDKEAQVISIVERYGQTFSGLRPYHDTDEDVVYCTADYTLPDDPERSQVIQELKDIGVGTAM